MDQTFFAQYYDHPMMGSQDWGWGFMVMLLFLALVGLMAWLIARSNTNNSSSSHNKTDPMEIAKTRYAKGDITKAQFDELKKDLKN
ncbi:SHOCT domain-containing protein [Candidatus Saccharibacteria bacterium]|nr:SHOCT domain-containing protein [Candidatus Saccharibacteria bacterium]